jgi:hypothetical protein
VAALVADAPVQRVLDRLERVRVNGAAWITGCPAHDDREPSLSVAVGDDGRVLIHCHAGCPTEAVVAAIGLEMHHLFDRDDGASAPTPHAGPPRPSIKLTEASLESLQARLDDALLARLEEVRGWRPKVVRALGLGFDDAGRIVIPYRDATGALVGVSRYAPNPARRNGRPKMLADSGSRREVFPPPEMLPMRDDWLFIAEGEPDAVRLLSCGIAAVAIPGVQGWDSRWRDRFAGRRLCLVFDCDPPGRTAAARVAADLAPVAADVRVLDLDSTRDDGFDVTDFLRGALTEGERAQGRRILMQSAAAAAAVVPTVANAGDGDATADISEGGPFALPLDQFIAAESGAPAALIGDVDDVILPRAGFLLLGGRGGRGKTTLSIEAALHLASGVEWLGLAVPQPLRVLILENEGPREPFRQKLAAKRATWPCGLSGAVFVHVHSWGCFTLKDSEKRRRLREFVEAEQIDLVVGDPLDLLGLDGVGSPEDTRVFLEHMKEIGLFDDVAWWLIHHLRKDRSTDELDELSGAWGGRPDAVLVLDALDDDRARLSFPKVRWGRSGRRPALILSFDRDREAFSFVCEEGDDERDLQTEIAELLGADPARWLTAKEIAAPKTRTTKPGIGANVDSVKATLGQHAERFELRTGDAAKEVSRSPSATVWQLRKVTQTAKSLESPSDSRGELDLTDSVTPPIRESPESSQVTLAAPADSGLQVATAERTLDEALHDPALYEELITPYVSPVAGSGVPVVAPANSDTSGAGA